MDPDKLRSLSQWLDQRTGRAAPSNNADVHLPNASVLRSLVESLAARSENSINHGYVAQQNRSNDLYQISERSNYSVSAYNLLNTGGISRTPNVTLLREVDPWMINVYERPPVFPPEFSDPLYVLAYQNALRERGYLPSSARPPSPSPMRVQDNRGGHHSRNRGGDHSRSRSPRKRRETTQRSPTPCSRRRSLRRGRSPTPLHHRERRSPILPLRHRRSRSPRVSRYQRPRSRQRSRSPPDRRRSRSPVGTSRRRSSQNSSRNKSRLASSNNRKIDRDKERTTEKTSGQKENQNNKPIDGNLRIPVALNEAIPYPKMLQYVKTAVCDFRRTWRRRYRDETDWNGYAYNIRCEIRAQLAEMCNFDGGENGKTFALLSPYLDNKMAMKMHTGCQMVKDLKKQRKKRKHRVLVGENSVKSYRVEDSYDCHHGFKTNYEHSHHDLANLQAINIILGIEQPQET